MVRKALVSAALAALVAVPATASAQEPFPVTGAIFTTDEFCEGVNLNIYAFKEDVYLSGGPSKSGSGKETHLPVNLDGYYVQVTEPNGTVLGSSVYNQEGMQRPFVVVPDPFDPNRTLVEECYNLYEIVSRPDCEENCQGYNDTSNPGGVYKVWVSSDMDFRNQYSKTDNFKVKGGEVPPEEYELKVIKFYDANVNGEFDYGVDVKIEGWMVRILEDVEDGLDLDRATTAQVILDAGTYIVSEYEPIENYWIPTTPTSETVTLPPDAKVKFGNVCIGEGGGMTPGFWSNKNGERTFLNNDNGAASFAALNALGLVDADGIVMVFTTYAQFRTWLLSANATNMAYMLSAQLAAMELNVLWGFVDENALVYAPGIISGQDFITINDLIDAAIAALAANQVCLAGDACRAYQELLKNALDDANNNYIFVQPLTEEGEVPCEFSFDLE